MSKEANNFPGTVSSQWTPSQISVSVSRLPAPTLTTRHLLLVYWTVHKSYMPEYLWKDTEGPGTVAASREGS